MALELVGFGNSPIGAIIGLTKSFTNTPTLPQGWLEANGQTVTDTGSVYNTQAIPNLNTGTQRYLRGSSTSGGTGGSDTHTHTIATSTTSASLSGVGTTLITSVTSPTGSTSTLPSYYEVVWIMRIK